MKVKIKEKINSGRFLFDDGENNNQSENEENVSVEASRHLVNQAKNVNPRSRWQQRRKLKKAYVKSRHGGSGQGGIFANSLVSRLKSAFGETGKSVVTVVKKPQVLLLVTMIFLMVLVLMSMFMAGAVVFEGAVKNVIFTSYTSENLDIVETDLAYTNMEDALQNQIDRVEVDYPSYDEYRYYLDEIEHDSHELASYLTALLQTYDVDSAKGELQKLFAKMYTLTFETIVEVRHGADDSTYNYYILEVTLKNRGVDAVARELLSQKQLEMYEIYLETEGNKYLVFGGGSTNDAPSTDLNGVVFEDGKRLGNENTVAIALSQVGNVGGETYWSWYGFESRVPWCACFVSWVLDKAGYNLPTFAACQYQGIPYFVGNGRWADSSFSDIAPGDVIFFDWECDGYSDHVGIVIGCDDNRVYVVEGNSNDACKVRDYALDSAVIMGYGLMN